MARRGAELIISGRIATLAGAGGFGWAEAVAIADGRVLAAGATSEVEALARPATLRWRLAPDELAMPAITDAHLHLMMLVRARSQADLGGARDRAETLALIAAAHRRLTDEGDRQGWLLGHGWAPSVTGGWPTAADLEQVAAGRPVALYSHDHHSRWVSAALRTPATPSSADCHSATQSLCESAVLFFADILARKNSVP